MTPDPIEPPTENQSAREIVDEIDERVAQEVTEQSDSADRSQDDANAQGDTTDKVPGSIEPPD